jgi:hypothetical protein
MATLEQTWRRITALLTQAAAALPEGGKSGRKSVDTGPLQGTLGEFREFLQHNEFELAWDALAEVAKREQAGAALWLPLVQAAALMKLAPQRKLASAELLRSLRHDDPKFRLVTYRKYRNAAGKVIWRPAASKATKSGYEPA